MSTIHILPEVYCKPHSEDDPCVKIKNSLKKKDDHFQSLDTPEDRGEIH